MPYVRPTIQQIATQTENDIYTRFGETSRPVRFSINKILARVIAGGLYLVYAFIEYCMKQIIPDTASYTFLKRWCSIFGVKEKLAVKAIGYAIFKGNDGAVIPAFTQIQSSDNFIFQTLFDATIENRIASVKIEAMVVGQNGNLKGGTKLNLISPVSNVESSCVLDENGTFNGTDVESKESLLARFLDRVRNPPCGGNKKDYETWALEVPGVTRAWCYPQYQGDGNVGVSFVRDNDDNIIPNQYNLEEVSKYISVLKPCTANLSVFAPTPNIINFTIKSSDISNDAKKQIQDQLRYLFINIANPKNTIFVTDILESLASIKTIQRISLVTPNQDIILDDKTVGIVGDITLQGF